MGTPDDAAQAILKDLDGLLTLNAWEATLLRGAREKAAELLGTGHPPPPPTNPPPNDTGTDCVGDGGDSDV